MGANGVKYIFYHTLNALNVADGPVATAQLPHRVPYGFHGWFENRA